MILYNNVFTKQILNMITKVIFCKNVRKKNKALFLKFNHIHLFPSQKRELKLLLHYFI